MAPRLLAIAEDGEMARRPGRASASVAAAEAAAVRIAVISPASSIAEGAPVAGVEQGDDALVRRPALVEIVRDRR